MLNFFYQVMSQLENSLVALYNDAQECVGAGVLVEPDLVLTCAHVVNLACGRNSGDTGRPDCKITLRFHLARDLKCTASVDADKEAWSDPPPSRAAGADLCLLRISADLPSNVIPATLCIRPDLIERKFRVAGFPADYKGDLDVAQGEISTASLCFSPDLSNCSSWPLPPKISSAFSTA